MTSTGGSSVAAGGAGVVAAGGAAAPPASCARPCAERPTRQTMDANTDAKRIKNTPPGREVTSTHRLHSGWGFLRNAAVRRTQSRPITDLKLPVTRDYF